MYEIPVRFLIILFVERLSIGPSEPCYLCNTISFGKTGCQTVWLLIPHNNIRSLHMKFVFCRTYYFDLKYLRKYEIINLNLNCKQIIRK